MKLAEMQKLPFGYGVAWWKPNDRTAIVLPLGLNYLARWCYGFWREFRHGMEPTRIDREIESAAQNAEARGYARGFALGHRAAAEELRQTELVRFAQFVREVVRQVQ